MPFVRKDHDNRISQRSRMNNFTLGEFDFAFIDRNDI
jgi:hypothetical protein